MTLIKLRSPRLYYDKFAELASYIAKPERRIINDLTAKEKLKEITAFYLVKMLITFILILIIEILFDQNNSSTQSFIERNHPFMVLLLGGFLAPLVEEAMFRLSIVFKPIFLSISIGLITLSIYSQIFDVGILKLDETIYLRYSTSFVVGLLTYYISVKNRIKIKQFWINNFRWIYYFSAISFGLFHFSNYDLALNNIFLIPILTLPNAIGGLFFGYIRVKHGFIYGLGFHCLNNIIALSLALLL